MSSVVSREYCLAHPLEIGQLYGWSVLFGAVLDPRRSVLDRVAASFGENRLAMPGALGHSYRLSELFEHRAAQLYRLMAERFRDVVPAHQLFKELQEEEEEHARLMRVCLFSVRVTPETTYFPSIRDAEVREVMATMRAVKRRIPTMTLDEALSASVALEAGEVNMVFGRLLKQVVEPEVGLLRQVMRNAETHQHSVPRRVEALRKQLGALGFAAPAKAA